MLIVSSSVRKSAGKLDVSCAWAFASVAVLVAAQSVGLTKFYGCYNCVPGSPFLDSISDLGVEILTDHGCGLVSVAGLGMGCLAPTSRVLRYGESIDALMMLASFLSPFPYCFCFDAKDPYGLLWDEIENISLLKDLCENVGAFFPHFGGFPICIFGAEEPLPLQLTSNELPNILRYAGLLAGLNIEGETFVMDDASGEAGPIVALLRGFGANVNISMGKSGLREIKLMGSKKLVAPKFSVKLPGCDLEIALLILAAMLTTSDITVISGVVVEHTQAFFLGIVKEMGADMSPLDAGHALEGHLVDLVVSCAELKPVFVDVSDVGSLALVLLIASVFVNGKVVLSGVGDSLDDDFSCELLAVLEGLYICGVKVDFRGNLLVVYGNGVGNVVHDAVVNACGNLNVAKVFSVFGMASECHLSMYNVDKSDYCDTMFVSFLKKMGFSFEFV